MTPTDLLSAAQEIAAWAPDAELVKNQAGNLAIMRDGDMIGWLNLRDGAIHWNRVPADDA